MELPDWVADRATKACKPGAVLLLVALFRSGKQRSDSNGERRCYWQGSVPQLAKLAGMSKRGVEYAETELIELGFLQKHRATSPNALHAISAAFDAPDSAKFAPLSVEVGTPARTAFESGRSADFAPLRSTTYGDRPLDDDDVSHSLETLEESSSPNTNSITTTTREKAVQNLRGLGVSDPEGTVRRYGPERCEIALAHLRFAKERSARIENDPGFVVSLITNRRPLFWPPITENGELADSFEERVSRFTGGRLGFLANAAEVQAWQQTERTS